MSLERSIGPDIASLRSPAGSSRDTFAYLALLAFGALDAAAYSIIAPVAPLLAERLGIGPGVIGVVVASFPLGIVAGFVVAAEVVRLRRLGALLAGSLLAVGVGALGFAAASELWQYLAARMLMGLGSGGLWMGVTFSTLERWPGQEYLCMSRIFAAYSVGGLVGPLLGSIGGIVAPFVALAITAFVGLALVAALPHSSAGRTFESDRSTLGLPAFRAASAGILFAVLALALSEGVLPLHLAGRLGQLEIGLLYAATAVVVAVAAALAARVAPRAALLAGVGLIVVGLGLVSATDAVVPWVAGLAVGGAGVGLANSGSIGVLLAGISTERSVTAIVVWSQLGIVGYLLGPLVGGGAAEAFGFGVLGLVLAAAALPVIVLVQRVPRPR